MLTPFIRWKAMFSKLFQYPGEQ